MSESNGNATDAMTFESLELIEVPIFMGDVKYVLREASEESATAYQIALLRGMQVVGGKVTGNMTGMAEAQSLLLSRCLFRYGQDGNFHPVDRNTIRTWPSRITKQLFTRLAKISEIEEEGDTVKLVMDRVLESLEEDGMEDAKVAVQAAFDHFLKKSEDKVKNAQSDTLAASA